MAALFALALVAPATAGPRSAPLEGEGEGLKLIANISYRGGTDMEIATIKGRDYAFAGVWSSQGGDGTMRVIDVTDPERPQLVATLACGFSQSDIQLSYDLKTLILAADSDASACGAEFQAGFATIDITNPRKPRPLAFAHIPAGSHNTTAHPTKPYVYNSSGSSAQEPKEIQIWSIKDPAKPKLVNTAPMLRGSPHALVGPNAPHDIGFNKDGSLAVTAARTHIDLFDTSDPENPRLLSTMQCPCHITHDAQFAPDGKHVFVGDELNGGSTAPCPGGALFAYEVQGTPEQPILALVGVYEPDELVVAGARTTPAGCTSHVFDISADSSKIAIAWYTAGVRYLDVSDPQGITVGGQGAGIEQLGWFVPAEADTWSAKFHKGPYIFTNDLARGFDVYKIGS